MKLGQKVKCKGYLKKSGNYVLGRDNWQKADNIEKLVEDKEVKNFVAIINGEFKGLNYEEDVTLTKIVQKDFKGFIVGKKTVYSTIYLEINYQYDGGEYEIFSTNNPIACYKVYYAFGKSRLVPCELVEFEEDTK
jgi:hypothetical protein